MTTAERKPHRNSPERAAMLVERAAEQHSRVSRFTPVPPGRVRGHHPRSPTWCTKRWTKARRPAFAKPAS